MQTGVASAAASTAAVGRPYQKTIFRTFVFTFPGPTTSREALLHVVANKKPELQTQFLFLRLRVSKN